jgi:1,4-dihydroxy-2-naphthoate octaprenyltransferase
MSPSPATLFAATRPAFLSITAVAALLGSACAFAAGIRVDPLLALVAALGALLAHAAANVINDVHDAENGSDAANNDRLAPFTGGSRFIQNGVIDTTTMRRLAAVLFAASAATGLWLLAHGPLALLAFGLAGLTLAWGYSAPPLKLMARGLGEFAVAAGWLLVVVGCDFVQRRQLAAAPLLAGAAYALMVAAVLFANQFPDLAADRGAGKANWVVRLGAQRARRLYPAIVASSHALVGLATLAGWLPPSGALALFAAPLAARGAWRLHRHAATPQRLRGAIVDTLAATHLFGLLLAAGFILAR